MVRCAETIVRLIELAEVSASCTTILTTAGEFCNLGLVRMFYLFYLLYLMLHYFICSPFT